MRRKCVIAAIGVALMCAPGTWLRTPVPDNSPASVLVERIAGASPTRDGAWQVAGVWRYSADSRNFGGYSALLAFDEDRFAAFSDRGHRFVFPLPRAEDRTPVSGGPTAEQDVPSALEDELWDIESATRDPATGHYWLGFENFHAILRYTPGHAPDAMRVLEGEVGWPSNAGAEAMIRLADGRFVVLPEGGDEGLVFASDPVLDASAEPFDFRRPVPGYAATDLAQLPDGRVLLLMRDTVFAIPPFETLIAIGPPPRAGEAWTPRLALRLDPVIPSENYEGLAVRPLEDGRVAVWLMADDNLSVLQRTLLAKLVFDPSAERD